MKATPQQLQVKPLRLIDRTFSNWLDHQFHCSCGIKFDGPYPERDPEAVPECPGYDPEDSDIRHDVACQTPQLQFKVKFKILGQTEILGAETAVSDAEAKYVDGYGEKGQPGYRKPLPLPPVNGKAVVAQSVQIRVATILNVAQFQANDDERYSI